MNSLFGISLTKAHADTSVYGVPRINSIPRGCTGLDLIQHIVELNVVSIRGQKATVKQEGGHPHKINLGGTDDANGGYVLFESLSEAKNQIAADKYRNEIMDHIQSFSRRNGECTAEQILAVADLLGLRDKEAEGIE